MPKAQLQMAPENQHPQLQIAAETGHWIRTYLQSSAPIRTYLHQNLIFDAPHPVKSVNKRSSPFAHAIMLPALPKCPSTLNVVASQQASRGPIHFFVASTPPLPQSKIENPPVG